MWEWFIPPMYGDSGDGLSLFQPHCLDLASFRAEHLFTSCLGVNPTFHPSFWHRQSMPLFQSRFLAFQPGAVINCVNVQVSPGPAALGHPDGIMLLDTDLGRSGDWAPAEFQNHLCVSDLTLVFWVHFSKSSRLKSAQQIISLNSMQNSKGTLKWVRHGGKSTLRYPKCDFVMQECRQKAKPQSVTKLLVLLIFRPLEASHLQYQQWFPMFAQIQASRRHQRIKSILLIMASEPVLADGGFLKWGYP